MSLISLNNIFKALPLPSLLLADDKDFTIVEVNNAFLKTIGVKYTDVLDKSVFEVFSENIIKIESDTPLKKSLLEVLHTKLSDKMPVQQLEIVVADSTEEVIIKYWEIENLPILDDDGKVSFIILSIGDITENIVLKKQLEVVNTALAKNEELLRKSENISKFGTWELDLATNALHWSEGVFRICDYEPNAFEVTFEKGLGIIHPDDRDVAIKEMFNTLQTGKEYKIEKRFVLEDSSIKYIISRGSLIKDTNGNNIKLFGVFQDITDEKLQQLALEKAKEELNKIMNSSLDIICTINSEGHFVQVSAAAFKILGYTPEELVGKAFIDFVFEDDLEITIQSSNDIMRGIDTTNFENRNIHKDGRLVSMIWSAKWDEVEKIMYCIARDTTEKKVSELAIIESAKQYRNLFENNPSPMFVWDFKTLKIIDCNEEALLKYGYTREEFLSLTILQIRPEEEIPLVYQVTQSEEAYGNINKKAWTHKKKNGELIKVEVIGHLMYYKGIRVSLVQIIDLTEKEATLQELRDNEIKLRTATRIAKLGYWQVNIREQKIYWSDEVFVIWGVSKDLFALDYESFLNTIHPQDKEMFVEKQDIAFAGGNNLDIEYRIILPDDTVKWVHEIGKTINDEHGEPHYLEGTIQDITEQKNGQIALKERNIFIETALEHLPIGIAVNKIDEGTATLMNKKFSEIYGWPTDVLVDIPTFFEKVYPDEKYRTEISQRIMADIQSGDERKMSWEGITITTQSGEKRIVNAKNIPIYEQNLIISTVVDVTDKFEVQNALIESNERYKFVSKATSDAIWDWDLENNTLFWGEGYQNIFGHKYSQLSTVENSWTQNLHPADLERIINSIKKVINSNENNWNDEYRYQKADGKYAYVVDRGFVIRDEQNNAIRMVGAMQDVTIQKEREQQLKLLESVVVNTKDAVLITEAEPFDEPGPRILYVNEAFTAMTGYTLEEVLGKNPRILQGPKSDRNELARMSDSMRKWETCEITILNYKKNGDEFWINFTVIPVADQTGWFTHWISIERDVTEVKIAEEAQKQLKQLELSLEKEKEINILKNRFTALASHEFRTPIATIISSIDIMDIYINMIENEGLKEKIKLHLNKIIFQSNRLTEMLRDILLLEKTTVSKNEFQVETIDIIDLISEIKEQYYSDRKDGRKLKLILPEENKCIHSNISFLNHIISNLVNNAFKYSQGSSNPTLTLMYYSDYFSIIITDYGMGVPVIDQQHLFELFFRANNVLHIEGTGLGLTITKEFTNKLGGDISFISQEGIGTTFTLKFPYDANSNRVDSKIM